MMKILANKESFNKIVSNQNLRAMKALLFIILLLNLAFYVQYCFINSLFFFSINLMKFIKVINTFIPIITLYLKRTPIVA